MVFRSSLSLFKTNWVKALKFFLYYIVVWGICFAMFLPVFLKFKDLVISNFNSLNVNFNGAFAGPIGPNLQNFVHAAVTSVVDIFSSNVALAIYGLIVVFVILPFFINLGKYALCQSLYSYMTSNSKIGFFSAYIKSLKHSVVFALTKTFYNAVFMACTCAIVFGLAYIENDFFVRNFLCVVEFIVLTLLFTTNHLFIMGWMPALIVFDCNIFRAYYKGVKAVTRHLFKTFVLTAVRFAFFWICVFVFGFYVLSVLIPGMAIALIFFGMITFYISQGMRYYVSATQIMTPKKLEEVDNINKTASIL